MKRVKRYVERAIPCVDWSVFWFVIFFVFRRNAGLVEEILEENRYHASLSPDPSTPLWQCDILMRHWNLVSFFWQFGNWFFSQFCFSV